MNGEELNYLAVTISNFLADGLTIDDISILSGFFSTIGSALGTIAATRSKIRDETYIPFDNEGKTTV